MAAGEGAPRGQAAGRAVTSPARPDGQVVELVQGPADFVRYADQLGLDLERFNHHLRKHAGAQRIAEDVEGADLSGVSGTPTFFINGRRHYGAYDLAALSAAVRGAGAGRAGGVLSGERRPTARLALALIGFVGSPERCAARPIPAHHEAG
jgi:glutaredoxin